MVHLVSYIIYIWDKRTAAFINKSQVGETFGYLQYRLKCTVKHNVSFFSSSVVLKGHYNRIKYLSALHRKYGRNFNNIVSAEFLGFNTIIVFNDNADKFRLTMYICCLTEALNCYVIH